MTEQQVAYYGELFQKLQLTELQIEEEGTKLLLKRETTTAPFISKQPASQEVVQSTSAAQSISDQHYDAVKAPLLGIFHRAASPNTPPFVEEGDHVKKGDVLCVIEAMKMMNEITAGRDGVIMAVCAEDNGIVEYGQKIFEIL